MNKYYDGRPIDSTEADYRIIFGDRSTGKTYHALVEGMKRYFDTGEIDETAIIRRWEDDFIGENSSRTCYDALNYNGEGVNIVDKLSKGKYSSVHYYAGRFYFYAIDEKGKEKRTEKYIATAFALNAWEHSKGGQHPHITTIVFDEFITRTRYLVDEFVTFSNMLSTIIRKREDDIVIYMLGNTINKFTCPYFTEMGLNKIATMKRGEIDVYSYGESDLRVAVEYTPLTAKSKKTNKYFAFDNPRLNMITGEGDDTWEMLIYPHNTIKYLPTDILFTYFITHNQRTCQCEIIYKNECLFTYIHRKSTPLKSPEHDLIYSREFTPSPNWKRNILKPYNDIDKKVKWFFDNDKVFYQDNEVGELVNSYLLECRQ